MELEIGGYRELDLRHGYEYYHGGSVGRLNSGRAGIYHAVRIMNCSSILQPYYQCETVRDFMLAHNITVNYYPIDSRFRPILPEKLDRYTALVVVNYFGLLSETFLSALCMQYPNIIIDNTQAFFCSPIDNSYCVYSPRKFFGVPDGCYVIGEKAATLLENYHEDFSGTTCSFLLTRIETGGNQNHAVYLKNEERISQSGIKRMSKLTHALLDNVDYDHCKAIRKQNFKSAKALFDPINEWKIEDINPEYERCTPMVYPLLLKNGKVRERLIQNHVYVGHWWNYIIREMPGDSWEVYLSKYMIPIQIDQRYRDTHIRYVFDLIQRILSEGRGQSV